MTLESTIEVSRRKTAARALRAGGILVWIAAGIHFFALPLLQRSVAPSLPGTSYNFVWPILAFAFSLDGVLLVPLGFTAIYVTHDQEEALALSDIVIVMNHGRVEAIASPRELFTNPKTPFVAGFVGFDNLYEGEIDWVCEASEPSPSGHVAWRPIGVSVNGASLRSFWHGDASPKRGMAVTLAFRSERVSLRPHNGSERNGPEANQPETNQYDGIVEACVYLGKFQDCIVAVGPFHLHAIGPADAAIQLGNRVTISIKPEECLVFARNATEEA